MSVYYVHLLISPSIEKQSVNTTHMEVLRHSATVSRDNTENLGYVTSHTQKQNSLALSKVLVHPRFERTRKNITGPSISLLTNNLRANKIQGT